MRNNEIKLQIAICDDETYLDKIKKITEQYFTEKEMTIEIQCYQDAEDFLQKAMYIHIRLYF